MIGSHYDTVRFSPGANDNLSAVAVSLEVARVLMSLEEPPTIIIAAFTLEEGHPGLLKHRTEMLQKHGIKDANDRFVTIDWMKAHTSVVNKARMHYRSGEVSRNLYEYVVNNEELTSNEKKIAEIFCEVYKGFDEDKEDKALGLVGSSYYVDEAVKNKVALDHVIVYDCLGWMKQGHSTQRKLPITKEMAPFIQNHKIDEDKNAGNFIGIFGDINSAKYLHTFTEHCRGEAIDIPHMGMHIPVNYKQIKTMMPDVLRSDHAPFWKHDIPGIFISDFANFRSDLYHTAGDISHAIDYDMLRRITIATLNYIIN